MPALGNWNENWFGHLYIQAELPASKAIDISPAQAVTFLTTASILLPKRERPSVQPRHPTGICVNANYCNLALTETTSSNEKVFGLTTHTILSRRRRKYAWNQFVYIAHTSFVHHWWYWTHHGTWLKRKRNPCCVRTRRYYDHSLQLFGVHVGSPR